MQLHDTGTVIAFKLLLVNKIFIRFSAAEIQMSLAKLGSFRPQSLAALKETDKRRHACTGTDHDDRRLRVSRKLESCPGSAQKYDDRFAGLTVS
ncbi:hypothetical protein D3C77_492320 [compost metagenome]